jgi:two-component system, OmpR family, response regulator QseB
MRILLAEDNLSLGDALRAGLRLTGFQVDWVQDGVAASRECKANAYAAMVLDIGLPRQDGLAVLAEIRALKILTPVLMLTARDAPEDIAKALDGGADDYVVKPVDIQVLAARLRALVRRASGLADEALQVGELRLHTASRMVSMGNVNVAVNGKEFEILQALMLAGGRILSRESLARHIYAWGEEVDSNAVEVHVHHLRKKLGEKGRAYLATVRGVGYQIKAP